MKINTLQETSTELWIVVFWIMMPCSVYVVTLKINAIGSSEIHIFAVVKHFKSHNR